MRGVDLSRRQIVDHGLRRRIDPRIDHQRIGLGVHHQTVDRHVGRGRRAGHDADMLALQALVLQRRDIVEPAARLGDQRIGGAVIGIGALHQIVALRKAHDDVATMRGERHPDEAGGLREDTCSRASSAASRRTARRACSRIPRPCRSRTADCADRRIPSARWDRPVRSTDRCSSLRLRAARTAQPTQQRSDRQQTICQRMRSPAFVIQSCLHVAASPVGLLKASEAHTAISSRTRNRSDEAGNNKCYARQSERATENTSSQLAGLACCDANRSAIAIALRDGGAGMIIAVPCSSPLSCSDARNACAGAATARCRSSEVATGESSCTAARPR